MSDALQRGSVVLRGGRYGVVWSRRGGVIVAIPVSQPGDAQRAHDVVLSFAELLAAGIELPEAILRAAHPIELPSDGQVHVGELAGDALCRLALATIRAWDSARWQATWGRDRRHQGAARSNSPVRGV